MYLVDAEPNSCNAELICAYCLVPGKEAALSGCDAGGLEKIGANFLSRYNDTAEASTRHYSPALPVPVCACPTYVGLPLLATVTQLPQCSEMLS